MRAATLAIAICVAAAAVAVAATGPSKYGLSAKKTAEVKELVDSVTPKVSLYYSGNRNKAGKQPARFFHAKTQVALRAKFVPLADNADSGIFTSKAKGGVESYDAVIRLSSGDPEIKPDSVADLKGFAAKVHAEGFSGTRTGMLPNGEDDGDAKSQDFIAATGEPFFFKHAKSVAKVTGKLAEKRAAKDIDSAGWGFLAGVSMLVNIIKASDLLALKRNVEAAKELGSVPVLFDVKAFHSQTTYSFRGRTIRYKYVPSYKGVDKNAFRSKVGDNYYRENTIKTLEQTGANVTAEIDVFAVFPGPQDNTLNPQAKWTNSTAEHIGKFVLPAGKPREEWEIKDSNAKSLSFNPGRGFMKHAPLGELNAVRVPLYQRASKVRVNGKYYCPFDGSSSAPESAASAH